MDNNIVINEKKLDIETFKKIGKNLSNFSEIFNQEFYHDNPEKLDFQKFLDKKFIGTLGIYMEDTKTTLTPAEQIEATKIIANAFKEETTYTKGIDNNSFLSKNPLPKAERIINARFIEDSGHGWLEIAEADLKKIGFNEKNFLKEVQKMFDWAKDTGIIFNKGYAYFEEDVNAGLISNFLAKKTVKLEVENVYVDNFYNASKLPEFYDMQDKELKNLNEKLNKFSKEIQEQVKVFLEKYPEVEIGVFPIKIEKQVIGQTIRDFTPTNFFEYRAALAKEINENYAGLGTKFKEEIIKPETSLKNSQTNSLSQLAKNVLTQTQELGKLAGRTEQIEPPLAKDILKTINKCQAELYNTAEKVQTKEQGIDTGKSKGKGLE